MEEKVISVNIINRNYPPNKGITGESAADLARFLISKGIKVNVITISNSAYGGGGGTQATTSDVQVFGIRTFYNGKNKLLRLLSSLSEGYRLARKAISVETDWNIVMTDPPLLNFFASLIFRHRKNWILWSMDVYPEAFVSAGLMKDNSPVFKFFSGYLKRFQPNAIISLGPAQTEYLRTYYPQKLFFELPCGIYKANPVSSAPDWKGDGGKILLGYCGNLGEAHSVPFLKHIIDNLNTNKFSLVLSLYGSKAEEMTAYAIDRPGVRLVTAVPREHLSCIDIHIASLLDNWVNVCVPSKTVSSVCAGATFLYFGRADADNWLLLSEAGWLIRSDSNLEEEVIRFLKGITIEQVAEKKRNALHIAERIRINAGQTYEEIYGMLLSES